MAITVCPQQSWVAVPGTPPAICRALGQAFGVEFELWSSDAEGATLSELAAIVGRQGGIDEHFPGGSEDLTFEYQASIPNGEVFYLLNSLVVLTVQIESTLPARQIAVATIPPAAPELVRSCVSTAFELCKAQSLVEQHDNRLTSYAEQLSECYEELVWLRELDNHITQCRITRTTSEVADRILSGLRELIRAETVLLVRVHKSDSDSQPQRVTVDSWHGEANLMSMDCINRCGQFIEEQRNAFHYQPIVRNVKASKTLPLPGVPNVHSLIVVPVTIDDEEHGWLVALNRCLIPTPEQHEPIRILGDDEFGTVEATLVQTAAAMLATHGHNSKLFMEKEELMLGVVKSLVRSLEARDQYTCGHSDRVASLSRLIAEEMGCSKGQVDRLYVAGLLHDIGKVGIPDSVLNKPGRLTDEEFEIIKTHPVVGYDILKNLRQFEFVLPAVRHHHEEMSGRGYPDGLVGEEIPLDARIMAVADAYDAMTSNRPYRMGMSFETAEAILETNRGPQWDPHVLDAFFRRRDDIRELCRDHKMDSVMDKLGQGLATVN